MQKIDFSSFARQQIWLLGYLEAVQIAVLRTASLPDCHNAKRDWWLFQARGWRVRSVNLLHAIGLCRGFSAVFLDSLALRLLQTLNSLLYIHARSTKADSLAELQAAAGSATSGP